MLLVHADDSFLRLVRSLGIPAPSRTLPSDMAQVSREKLERALKAVGVAVVGPSMTAAEADAIALAKAASHSSPAEAGETSAVADIAELHRLALDATARVVANVGSGGDRAEIGRAHV